MFKRYIVERRSWIFLFIFLQLLFLFIAYIDPSIPFSSILYIVFLSIIVFLAFFIIRYHKESSFHKNMQELDDVYDLHSIEETESPFEEMIIEFFTRQAKQHKAEIDKYRFDLEQEKDELLSWIHEIKTPLTTLHLMIDRIEDDSLKSKMMYEWLRIDLLLDQQLHQKRIPFIENDLHIGNTALKSVIHKEINVLRDWCLQKGIGFELNLEVKEVLSDSKWLGFLIRQILTNAVKYSSDSDIVINSYNRGNHTKLEIKDVGKGIEPKDLPRIFDKGFTSTDSKRDQSATGMGLYLAKKVAFSLLIEINVDSTIHEGTTFTLTFPQKNEFIQIMGM
ncbi:sensor histidine kinase [Pseudogracilibacillus sp. SE30717A]|uniref:sensor histidine kinase n=1 Tax=Pseudogracilibacillus sp. SE30717A TaxID=3098293 RepID=UPI00300E6BC2